MGFLAKAVPEIVGGAFGLGSAALQNRAAGKAAELQSRSAAEALAFEREKEAARRAEYEKGLMAWAAGRRLLAQRYGLNPEEVMPMGSIGVTGGNMAAQPQGAPMARRPVEVVPVAAGGANLRDLIAEGTGADIGGWSDWGRYGLR